MSHSLLSVPRAVVGVIALMAGHSRALLLLSWPMPACGALFLAVAALGLMPEWAVLPSLGATVSALLLLAAAFNVHALRLLLASWEPPSGFLARLSGSATWKQLGALALLLGLAAIPGALGSWLASLLMDAGLPEQAEAVLAVALPVLAAQAATPRLQLLWLPGLALGDPAPWRSARHAARGHLPRLAALNVLLGVFWLGVNLFAGWLVGAFALDGSQAQLELLTEFCCLPVQLGAWVCLQAICHIRLNRSPEI
ncbi:hypothetical protein [Fundidesulfovibrio agrisoli]|uniref:hypothetical protein n=1 Tax=Fundidesulfovibrio agrisoli TaxID=2922717 RepID=UPI001FACBE30|nr:hypothetical protein [Fundidesulfovibrio agrisoli]